MNVYVCTCILLLYVRKGLYCQKLLVFIADFTTTKAIVDANYATKSGRGTAIKKYSCNIVLLVNEFPYISKWV